MDSENYSHLFTSTPIKGNVLILRENLYVLLIERLLYKLQFIEEKSKINLTNIKEKLLNLNPKKKLCSGIFAFDSSLGEGLRGKDLGNTIDVLHELNKFLDGPIYIEQLKIESILDRSWENYFINILRKQKIDHPLYKTVLIRPTLGISLDQEGADVNYILTNLKNLDDGISEEIEHYVCYLKFFSGKALVGATSKQNFGTIYLRLSESSLDQEQRYLYYIEHLTHEVSHLQLHALMELDPIIVNDCNALYDAPIRPDPRPMFGIFHATFVLSRVLRTLKKFQDAGIVNTNQVYDDMLNRYRRGYAVVKRNAQFTEAGKLVFESFERTAGLAA